MGVEGNVQGEGSKEMAVATEPGDRHEDLPLAGSVPCPAHTYKLGTCPRIVISSDSEKS
jgi:hypothetical protein